MTGGKLPDWKKKQVEEQLKRAEDVEMEALLDLFPLLLSFSSIREDYTSKSIFSLPERL